MHIFDGLKIIDCTKVYSGPLATRFFADYGAEVIKVENADSPDDAREFPPLVKASGYFETLNRNKYFISLNLKNKEQLAKFYSLIKTADVFVENMTPDTKLKLKIDYQTLQLINPTLIYASLSGHGQTDNRKYYDVIAQAESGLISLTGTQDTPTKIGPPVVDAFSGMTLAFAISSALYYREKTGKGQFIDVSMFAASMNLLESNLVEYSVNRQNPNRMGNLDTAIAPFGLYKTKDGHIAIACGNDRLWTTLQEFLLGEGSFNPELFATNSLRIRNQNVLTEVIEGAFSKYDSKGLCKTLQELAIPCSEVNHMSDVVNNAKNYADETIVKYTSEAIGEVVAPGRAIKFSEDSQLSLSPAKSVGADNERYGI